jgi:hypothetical protein
VATSIGLYINAKLALGKNLKKKWLSPFAKI